MEGERGGEVKGEEHGEGRDTELGGVNREFGRYLGEVCLEEVLKRRVGLEIYAGCHIGGLMDLVELDSDRKGGDCPHWSRHALFP